MPRCRRDNEKGVRSTQHVRLRFSLASMFALVTAFCALLVFLPSALLIFTVLSAHSLSVAIANNI